MKYMINLLGFCFFATNPVVASNSTVIIGLGDCKKLIEHRARSNIYYKEGYDIRGKKVAAAMATMPAASPSRPSNQLIALVMPTTQIIVLKRLNESGKTSKELLSPSHGSSIAPIRKPCAHIARPTAI